MIREKKGQTGCGGPGISLPPMKTQPWLTQKPSLPGPTQLLSFLPALHSLKPASHPESSMVVGVMQEGGELKGSFNLLSSHPQLLE